MKNRYVFSIIATLCICAGFVISNTADTFSARHFEAEMWNSGQAGDIGDIDQAIAWYAECEERGWHDKNANGEYIYDADGNLKPGEVNTRTGEVGGQPSSAGGEDILDQSSEPAPATAPDKTDAAPAKSSTKTGSSNKKSNPKAEVSTVYSHEYDSITDDAKNAFIAFTNDGEPESCYLIIKASSVDNVITGKELNATRIGKEDGLVTFVDDNDKAVYKWKFSNWDSPDNYTLELGMKTEILNGHDDACLITFAANKTIENDVDIKVNVGMPNAELISYRVESGEYNKLGTVSTDEDGYVVLTTRDLTEYVVSKSELLNEKPDDTAEITEPEKTEEPAAEPEVKEAETLDIPDSAPIEDYDYKPLMYKIVGGIICAGILCVAIGLIVYKRRR